MCSQLRHPAIKGREGSALLISIFVLASLGVLAAAIAVTSMGDRNLSKYDRHSLSALAAAETGIAFAKGAIVNRLAPLGDADSDGRPDFALTDSLNWGGAYRVVAETDEPIGNAYHANQFTIVSEGRYRGATRRVRVVIQHDTFLKFARFIEDQSVIVECGDVLSGEVYSGLNLTLSCGCPPGKEPLFIEKVYTEGSVPQAGCGVFELGYDEAVAEIPLALSFDWDEIRDKARGLGATNDCEGRGAVGLYFNLPGTDPLGLGGQPGDDVNTVVYDWFDFMNNTSFPPDTVVTYRGVPVVNTLTGLPMLRSEFNGIVFFEGTGRVRGTLDGVSAFGISTYASNDLIIMGNIIRGYEGFDPVTRLPNGGGNPVTTAVIAETEITFWEHTPKVLRMDTAIFVRDGRWRGSGGVGEHPTAVGPLDLDIDGIVGETPVNNDPDPGMGWDELNIDEHTWVLNFDGPIITRLQGDAYPWNSSHVINYANGPTHRHHYSLDYQQFPPACFPFPSNLWIDVSWTEIFEVQSPLASELLH